MLTKVAATKILKVCQRIGFMKKHDEIEEKYRKSIDAWFVQLHMVRAHSGRSKHLSSRKVVENVSLERRMSGIHFAHPAFAYSISRNWSLVLSADNSLRILAVDVCIDQRPRWADSFESCHSHWPRCHLRSVFGQLSSLKRRTHRYTGLIKKLGRDLIYRYHRKSRFHSGCAEGREILRDSATRFAQADVGRRRCAKLVDEVSRRVCDRSSTPIMAAQAAITPACGSNCLSRSVFVGEDHSGRGGKMRLREAVARPADAARDWRYRREALLAWMAACMRARLAMAATSGRRNQICATPGRRSCRRRACGRLRRTRSSACCRRRR